MPSHPKLPRLTAATLFILTTCLTGCATHPEPAPRVDVPAQWTVAQPGQTGEPLTREWFRAFGSTELDTLITSAYENSFDVQAANARLQQADARARIAGAPLLPQVDFGADATTYAGHSSNGSAHETDTAALVSASYEVDFWGKNRAARDSARAALRASDADRSVVVLTTVTGVATAYFEVVALREETTLAQSTADNARHLLELVEARAKTGLANPAEVAQQRAAVANTEIRIQELRQQESAALAALAILVGKMPDTLKIEAHNLSSLATPRVAPGLPSELLARRPDVAAAESNLQSAHADLVQARAAFFPTLTLTGSGGIQNPAVQAAVETLSGVGPTLTVGAALAQTIFDGGRLRAARDEAGAKEQEMLASYRAAALAALWDVEVALSAIHYLDRQADAQRDSLEQSELGFASAQARYRAGSGDFLTVLDAERTLIGAREQMTQYRLARLQAAVGLCKALGGGWLPG
ncbi:MAG TPA: efflux transporter outer membrane subunit [Steroidobacteraceae bacterium]|nr:efflux transporter outer membrane subunit [Steroidobacteraceae bacterium]